MKTRLAGLIVCMALISVSQASAATLVGTTTDAMGIDGLVVDSVTYDVMFVNATYDTVYGSTPPTFFGNGSGAADAATALSSALNSLLVDTISGATAGNNAFYIPYAQFAPDEAIVYVVFCNVLTCISSGDTWAVAGPGIATQDQPSPFAVFVIATTPLPAALPLFATGLGAMGLLGWRRKRKNAAIAA